MAEEENIRNNENSEGNESYQNNENGEVNESHGNAESNESHENGEANGSGNVSEANGNGEVNGNALDNNAIDKNSLNDKSTAYSLWVPIIALVIYLIYFAVAGIFSISYSQEPSLSFAIIPCALFLILILFQIYFEIKQKSSRLTVSFTICNILSLLCYGYMASTIYNLLLFVTILPFALFTIVPTFGFLHIGLCLLLIKKYNGKYRKFFNIYYKILFTIISLEIIYWISLLF